MVFTMSKMPPLLKLKDSSSTITTSMPRPAASTAYLYALNAAKSKSLSAYNSTPLQQAFCLYLIVTKGSDDPDVLEQFSPGEIKADSDLGLTYFVDGWGNPIYFLRWAPAFVSPLQPANSTQHDQFDPLNVDPNQPTHPLYPLVYSAGPDGIFDLNGSLNVRRASHFTTKT